MAIDAVNTRETPQRHSPYLGGGAWERGAPAELTMVTAGIAMTAAQLKQKLFLFNSSDNGTLTLPTADAIIAANPGVGVGDKFEFEIVQYGNHTITLAVNTGITNKVIDSEDAILTIATHIGTRWALICTGRKKETDPATSNAFDLVLLGTSTCTS